MLKIAVPTNKPGGVANYISALEECGARGEAAADFKPDEYDGLLLPGGYDINPVHYGKTKLPDEVFDDELDTLQFRVLERFLEAGKPVFGICRGHQMLNIAFGGTLIQDLPGAEKHRRRPDDTDNVHMTRTEPKSFVYQIYGSVCSVNSSHHQAIDIPGKGFRPVMWSEDGVIEAAEHESLPVWSVQWHPERMCFRFRRGDTADGSGVFRFFLEKCGAR